MLHRLLLVEVANYKIVTVLAVIPVFLVARALLRRQRRPFMFTMAGLVAVLCVADSVNTYYGYLPQVGDVLGVVEWRTVTPQQVLDVTPAASQATQRTETRADAVVSMAINGTVSGFGRHHVLIALPPQYFSDPSRRFPVVYLLHGSPGRPQDWLRANRLLSLIRQPATAAQPMIFVMPPMSRGWLDDSECVDGQHERVETWLVDDVVPAVDAWLRTIPDRQHRALAGMSAGGYGALNLAIRHSDMFSAALDMSGYTKPTYAGGLRHLFGVGWQSATAANTPSSYLAAHHLTLPLHLRFDAGRADTRPLREIRQLLPRLLSARADASLILRGGGHTYHVWVPALRQGLSWLAAIFSAAGSAGA